MSQLKGDRGDVRIFLPGWKKTASHSFSTAHIATSLSQHPIFRIHRPGAAGEGNAQSGAPRFTVSNAGNCRLLEKSCDLFKEEFGILKHEAVPCVLHNA
jgi:hypothetical protein